MTTTAGSSAPTFHRVASDSTQPVPVRNREYLAGSTHQSFPEAIPDVGDLIPILTSTEVSCSQQELAGAVRTVLDESLAESGGVLLRGLPLAEKADFEALVESLGYPPAGYQGGIAVRERGSGVALVASQEDPRITLSPHNEMAYLPEYPRRIFFFCQSAATAGGQVPINDIRQSKQLIPAAVLERFRERGIRYHRRLPRESRDGEIGWVDTFGLQHREQVEQQLAEQGYQVAWAADDELEYSYQRSAFVDHPDTGEELWFNQVTELHSSYWRDHPGFPSDLAEHEYPATTSYGNGEPIEPELISSLRGILWQTSRAVQMQPSDVLVLDNQVMQHGRFAYQGPRRHFVSLTR